MANTSLNSKLESQLISIIEEDTWMLELLKAVRDLELNDCWIGAGFVRNKIWDILHNKTRTALNDVDVIHFTPSHLTKEFDLDIELRLKEKTSTVNWSVKNQARMHIRNQHLPYTNCEEAISYWPETATAIAIRINNTGSIEVLAPYGLQDLFDLIICPTPNFNPEAYKTRIEKKQWQQHWELLKVKI